MLLMRAAALQEPTLRASATPPGPLWNRGGGTRRSRGQSRPQYGAEVCLWPARLFMLA